MPKFVERCRANSSNSVNEPGSSSASIRSRAVILPAACCFSTARSEPAWVASCTRRSKSASLPAVVWRSTSSGTFSPALCSSAAVTGRSVRECPTTSHPAGRIWSAPRWTDPLCRAHSRGTARCGGRSRWCRRSAPPTPPSRPPRPRTPRRERCSWPSTRWPGGGPVLGAEPQAAGGGRLAGVGTSPPRAGLTVSFLLRPDVPAARRGWLSLLTGVALAESVGEVTGVRASLTWPNDLLALDGRKLAGILAEAVSSPTGPGAVVVGTGLNVDTDAAELPDTGTSLSMVLGAPVDRGPVLLAFLRAVERRYRAWTEALGDPVSSGLTGDYLAWSSTVGTTVSVTLPDGSTLEGTAQAVDWDGRLVVATGTGTVELASGDVRHVRG